MKTLTQKTVMTALLSALCCVATMVIRVPSPYGYLNLGDGVVLLSAAVLPLGYAFAAASIGSALADVLSGYFIYAPATFVIKGLMALAAGLIYNAMLKNHKPALCRITSSITAEVVMIAGYFTFESIVYGVAPAVVNVPLNSIQGIAGLLVGNILINIFKKSKMF